MTLPLLFIAACTWAALEAIRAGYEAWLLEHAHESLQAAGYEVAQDERRWADPTPGALPVRCFATADNGLVVEFYGSPGPDHFGSMRR